MKKEEAPLQKRMLICLAHPDDESFGMGGTIAYYAKQGVEIYLICATRGEAGTVDDHFLEGYSSIGELREDELKCAANVLGIAKVIYLDYRDSGMRGSADNQHKRAFINVAEEDIAEKIVRVIRRIRPQVLLSFDATGGYHHPDHIAIHKATVLAFHSASDPSAFPDTGEAYAPQSLYVNALSRRRVRMMVKLMPLVGRDPKRLGRNQDIDLTLLAVDDDTPAHVTINYASVSQQKKDADRCHASQIGDNGLSFSSIARFFWRMAGQKDRFTRLFPETDDHYRSQDLFA